MTISENQAKLGVAELDDSDLENVEGGASFAKKSPHQKATQVKVKPAPAAPVASSPKKKSVSKSAEKASPSAFKSKTSTKHKKG